MQNWHVSSADEIARAYGFELPPVFEELDGPSTLAGAGLPDFNALVSSDPTFAAGWNAIAPQLEAEGQTDLTGAKIAFADSYTSLISSAFGSIDPSSAIEAAKKYVTIGQTIVGAVGTVSQLIQAGNSGENPTQVFQAFTGSMIALAVSTGLSAGVGAAIVGVVSIAIDVIDNVIGGPKQVYDSTDPSCTYGPFDIDKNNPPSFGVGCIAAWGPSYTPDSPYWRSFPTPPTVSVAQAGSGLLPIPIITPQIAADAPWFVRGQIGPGSWRGAFFGAVNPNTDQANTPDKWWSPPGVNPAGTDQNARPIDNAFPSYAAVIEGNGGFGSFDVSTWPADWQANFANFVAAFQAAWRANAAYALNGLKPQDDWQVLVHLLRMWNKSHAGPAYSLLDSAQNYIGGLVTQALGHGSQSEIADGSGHGLSLNMGGLLQPPVVSTTPGAAAPTPATSSTSSGAAAAVTIVTAGAAAGAWWLLGKPLTLAALKASVEELVHMAAGVLRR